MSVFRLVPDAVGNGRSNTPESAISDFRSVGRRRVAGANRVCDVPRETSQLSEFGYVQDLRRVVDRVCQTGRAVELQHCLDQGDGRPTIGCSIVIDHSGSMAAGKGRPSHSSGAQRCFT